VENNVEDNSDDDDGIVRLGVLQLIAPLLISFLGTSIGLIMFFITKLHSSKDQKENPNSKQFDTIQHQVTASIDDENVSRSTISTKSLSVYDSELLQELKKQSVSKLLTTVNMLCLEGTEVDEAINQLPNTTSLVEVVFKKQCSQAANEMIALKALDTSKLIEILDDGGVHSTEFDSLAGSSSNSVELKENIIMLIMSNKYLKRQAISAISSVSSHSVNKPLFSGNAEKETMRKTASSKSVLYPVTIILGADSASAEYIRDEISVAYSELITSISCVAVKPTPGHISQCRAVEITLADQSQLEPVLKFFFRRHDPTVPSPNGLYSSFILTDDLNVLEEADKVVSERQNILRGRSQYLTFKDCHGHSIRYAGRKMLTVVNIIPSNYVLSKHQESGTMGVSILG